MKVKKTKAKRILSLLLALVMIISAVPLSGVSVFAQTSGDFEYEILDDGTAEITGYNGSASNLVIPSKIDGYKVTSIGYGAFAWCNTNVTIPNSVTNIKPSAFSYSSSLENITVDAENTAYSDIDGVLFNKGQTEIIRYPINKKDSEYTLPYGVTSIGGGAFKSCNHLTNITIPNSVTNIGYSAFEKCYSLTNITIPNSVTSIGDSAFSGCSSLVNIFIPNSVTSIGSFAFYSCKSLANITIPNSVTDIGYSAFSSCESLTNITIPNSVTFIGDLAFYGCRSLTNITISNSVTRIGYSAFHSCPSLENITVDARNTVYSDIDGVLFNKEQTTIIQYPSGKKNSKYSIPNGVTTMETDAFSGCGALKSVVIPNGVRYISNDAFSHCSSLSSVEIPISVKSIGDWAFVSCPSLMSITIPDSVDYIGVGALGIADPRGGKSISPKTGQYDKDGHLIGFKIYGCKGTTAEDYAKEYGFEFIALGKKTDKATGISVSERELNILPDGAALKAEKLSAEANKIIFDISLVKNGAEVQPNGEVTVKIPVPEGMRALQCKVYREETDGSFTDMKAYYANGYMVFTTDHFSKYILAADKAPEIKKGDVNGNGIIDAADAVLIQRYDAGLVKLDSTQLKAADINSDGIADASDAVIIMRYDAGIISQL